MTTLFADFNNADSKGRIRLNCRGTFNDIKNKNIELKKGLEVLLDDDDELTNVGIVEFSIEEDIWVAIIDWNKFNQK